MADNRLLAEQDLWFSPGQMYEGAKNALLYPFRNPDKTAEFGLSMAPGSGEAMSARDAWDASGRAGNALLHGNYGEAASGYGDMALGIAGALPGAGIIARGTKRGAAWMDRNLPSGVNRLLDAVTPSDPKNTMNVFAGPTAKTADHAALTKAQEMVQSGASRDEIWRDTGWFQGVDGKWRFEIDDSGAALAGVKPPQSPVHASTFSGLSHPEYEAAYGDYLPKSISGVFDPRMNTQGQYSPFYDEIFAQGPTPQAAKGTTLHEVQHHTQELEDFARGSNPGAELGNLQVDTGNKIVEQLRSAIANGDYGQPGDPMFAAAYKDLLALEGQVNQQRALNSYKSVAGEVEARNVQSRMNMSAAERRATAPWLTQDVPDDQQIVRFGAIGPQASIPAWHGSPHDFDRFDMSKLGTGEGAQAYGHGLYFAENPAVAKSYRDTLGDADISVPYKDFLDTIRAASPDINVKTANQIASRIRQHMTLSGSLAEMRAGIASMPLSDSTRNAYNAALDLAEKSTVTPRGKLYHTELDVEPEDLLDWDRSISEQSDKVREAIGRLPEGKALFEQEALVRQLQGRLDELKTQRMTPEINAEAGSLSRQLLQERQRLQHLEARFEDYKTLTGSPAASQALREAGIPGIRFLDQGSRGAGQGSSNYVIFDQDLVKILSKE